MGMAVHVQTCEIYALKPLVIMLDFPFLRSGMGGISTLSGSRFGRALSIQHYSQQALRAGIRQRQLTEIRAKLNPGLPPFNTHQPVAFRIRFRCGHLQTSDEDLSSTSLAAVLPKVQFRLHDIVIIVVVPFKPLAFNLARGPHLKAIRALWRYYASNMGRVRRKRTGQRT